ncbi:class I SAM-dependent methyltransferase [Kitasatospora sp. NPDC001527]|uniref:class I SAM-dependent methyltransferase n=1 Tax=Kitasatospora sp. NPDC001527 TaxID=3154519 RepID=UPI0033224824
MLAPSYLPAMTLEEYLGHIASAHPHWRPLLDEGRLARAGEVERLCALSNEFDSDRTGRGDSYRQAHRDPLVRWTGARRLLHLAAPRPAAGGGEVRLLDVLGGDGLLARAVAARPRESPDGLRVLTGDICGPMVGAALAHGLPAVRQSADRLMLADRTVDAVLLAYGTHHIPAAVRPTAVAEAVRVLRPGGRVVVHDFEPHSPMADFFRTVVDRHGATGHDYPHLTRAELLDLFAPHPLTPRLLDVYDPVTVHAATPEQARAALVTYLADTYGLTDHFTGLGTEAAWHLITTVFDHTAHLAALPTPLTAPTRPLVRPATTGFVAELPRVALVAVAGAGPAQGPPGVPAGGAPGRQ